MTIDGAISLIEPIYRAACDEYSSTALRMAIEALKEKKGNATAYNMFNGYNEFLKLRQDVMNALGKIDMSYGCKSYEGTFELLASYPCFFDDGANSNEPDYFKITLHCYVLGPNRHYDWEDKTLIGAVNKAKKDIYRWIK